MLAYSDSRYSPTVECCELHLVVLDVVFDKAMANVKDDSRVVQSGVVVQSRVRVIKYSRFAPPRLIRMRILEKRTRLGLRSTLNGSHRLKSTKVDVIMKKKMRMNEHRVLRKQ